jgi:hypothetical protein
MTSSIQVWKTISESKMTYSCQDNIVDNYDEEGDLSDNFSSRRHLVKGLSIARYMDNDEIELMIAHYTSSDKSSDKTFTRIFVEEYLQKVSAS